MNEEKIEEAMSAYCQSLGSCSRVPERVLKRRPRTTFALATCVVLAVGLMVAWPRIALAVAVSRINSAIKNAQTMEIVSWVERKPGDWRVLEHTFYKSGAWRSLYSKADSLEVLVIRKDGWALTEYKKLDHATLQKADRYFDETGEEEVSAVEYAKKKIDFGITSIERQVSIKSNPDVNGRPTYLILMERSEDRYRGEIVVDKATDLPISSFFTTTNHDGVVSSSKTEYRFNQRLPNGMFELKSKRTVIKLPDEQEKLTKKWTPSLGEINGVTLRDACEANDGTIWLACTSSVSEQEAWKALPTRISVPGGAQYVRIYDVNPSAILGKTVTYSFYGQRVLVVGFIPLDPPTALPASASVEFTHRQAYYPGFAEPAKEEEANLGNLQVLLRQVKGVVPEYFPVLDLDRFSFSLPITIWETRAKALEEADRTLDAAKAYEQCVTAYAGFVKYVGYRPMLEAARCYRKLGMEQKAKDLEVAAKVLKDSKER